MNNEEMLKDFKKKLIDSGRSFEYVRARIISNSKNGIDVLTKQEYSMIWHNVENRFYSPKGKAVIKESYKIVEKEMKKNAVSD